MLRLLIVALCLWLSTVGCAHAYIDGGSAHMIIQGLIAAAAGVVYYFKHPRQLWAAIKRLFRKDKE